MQDDHTPIRFSTFLESTPPGVRARVSHAIEKPEPTERGASSPPSPQLSRPELHLHCPSGSCGTPQVFRARHPSENPLSTEVWNFVHLIYECARCRSFSKTFSVRVVYDATEDVAMCTKIGELPEPGPPIPPALERLLGPHAPAFAVGRRCEALGMGIGALTYYLHALDAARGEILEAIGTTGVVASVLQIAGTAPLDLLAIASKVEPSRRGDEECLELASSLRTVLSALAIRIDCASRADAETAIAIARLRAAEARNH